MGCACILGDLAEEVLTIDWFQWSSEQAVEVQTECFKLSCLLLSHLMDNGFWVEVSDVSKAFGYTIKSAGPGDHELVLFEIQKSRIIEVDHILKCEKWSKAWIR